MPAPDADPLNVDDLDPKLAEAVREREAAIRGALKFMSGYTSAMTAAAKAAAAARNAAQGASSEYKRNEWETSRRAEEVIKEQVQYERRGWRKLTKGPLSFLAMILPTALISGVFLTDAIPLETRQHLAPLLPITPVILVPFLAQAFADNRKRKRLSSQVIAAVLPAVATTPGEKAYTSAVTALLDAQSEIGAGSAREIIGSLNGLLSGLRRLQSQHEMVDQAMNAQSLAEAQEERERLSKRLENSRDEIARETLRESLALCEARLERAEAMSPMRERIEAQIEAALQVMASVRVSLAGLPLASSGASGAGVVSLKIGDPQRDAVRASADRLQRQTVAMENAVQEVLRLQA